MADIRQFKKPSLKEKYRGNTLCRNGHHKWQIETEKRFDVKRGKLVTSYRWANCGRTKNQAS